MPDYLLGIDLGTSGVRTGVYDRDGNRRGLGAVNYPIEIPAQGHAEQDPIVWWRSTAEAIRAALTESGIRGSDIAAISFSGQMHGTVLLDSTGEPIQHAVIWADSRSADECNEIEEMAGETRLNGMLMNHMFPGTQAATIRWLQKHDHDLWRRARRILLPKDYLRSRMCGLFNTESSDASGTLLFDVSRREWATEILDSLHIPVEYLPFIVNSDEHIGETEGIEDETGLPDGIPVVLGGADQPCTALGNGVIDPGVLMVTIGTGGQLFAPMSQPKSSPGLALNTFCHLPEQRWYVMGATLAAGLSMQWFRNAFAADVSYAGLDHEAADIPPGADGLRFQPYIAGRRSPVMLPEQAGTFSGIGHAHTRAHFARAVMEGVVFELRELFDIIQVMHLDVSRIVCSGGGAKSRLWMQMLANVFDLQVTLAGGDERACLGAALLAGMGVGWYKNYREAAAVAVTTGDTIDPNPSEASVYQDLYAESKSE